MRRTPKSPTTSALEWPSHKTRTWLCMELSRAVYKLGYRKWQYAADECDWLDTTDWKGPMPN